ncbi:hypothetical protein COO60DRAFT_1462501 [Scenedesmus sp. NREL 46B-D3]|nr:hypothetical protein COO60DRAFT_1462501 [Scenedesmus sp. NREL 46B-D3]
MTCCVLNVSIADKQQHSSEDIEATPVMSRSQRRRQGRLVRRDRAVAAAAMQPPPPQRGKLQAQPGAQLSQTQQWHMQESAPRLPQQQQQQQSSSQQAQASVRIGIRMLDLPT